MARKVWFITGASRGLGLAIARAVLEKGNAVVAAARNPNRAEEVLGPSDRVFAVSMDVTDRASIQRATEAAVARFGSVDVIVNNAGYGLMGAVEELDASELEDVFETIFSARAKLSDRCCPPCAPSTRAGSSIFPPSEASPEHPVLAHTMRAKSPSRAYRKRWRRSWLRWASVSSLSSRAIFAPIF